MLAIAIASSAFDNKNFAEPLAFQSHKNRQAMVFSRACYDASAKFSENSKKDESNPLKEFNLPSPLILGSASYTRKLILKEMGIPYRIVVRPINEKEIGDRDDGSDPSSLVTELAKAKGDHLVHSLLNDDEMKREIAVENEKEGWVVLTADQVVMHNGSILEKPESLEEARDFVRRYATHPPSTVGACVLTHIPSMIRVSGIDTAQINFFPSVAEGDLVRELCDEGAPVLKCAGGLMVEHPLVKRHVRTIDGTEDSVMGLSKDLVMALLQELRMKLDDWNGIS